MQTSKADILSKIEEAPQINDHSCDITNIIFGNSEEFGKKGILGQPPKYCSLLDMATEKVYVFQFHPLSGR
jgi:hypothetical protein